MYKSSFGLSKTMAAQRGLFVVITLGSQKLAVYLSRFMFFFQISRVGENTRSLIFSGTSNLPGANRVRRAFVFSVFVISRFHVRVYDFVVSWFQDLWISWFRGSAS